MSGGSDKPFWEYFAGTGIGLLILIALVMMGWTACSSGVDVSDGIAPSAVSGSGVRS